MNTLEHTSNAFAVLEILNALVEHKLCVRRIVVGDIIVDFETQYAKDVDVATRGVEAAMSKLATQVANGPRQQFDEEAIRLGPRMSDIDLAMHPPRDVLNPPDNYSNEET